MEQVNVAYFQNFHCDWWYERRFPVEVDEAAGQKDEDEDDSARLWDSTIFASYFFHECIL